MQRHLRFLSVAVAALFAAAPMSAAARRTLVTVWPGYIFELPSGYCVALSKGPDFDVLYIRERGTAEDNVLVGIYAGYAPSFDPECAKPTTRTWNSNKLRFKSVRGRDSCAELLIEDPTSLDRGKLHLWFGPAAKDHAQLADNVVSPVRPAVMPLADTTSSPPCD